MGRSDRPPATAVCHVRPRFGGGAPLLIVILVLAGCASSASPSASPTPSLGPASPSELPSAAPTATSAPTLAPATPTPIATPVGGRSQLVAHGDRASGQVALTFTVGYRLEPAIEILELLRERGVAATIFMSGVVFDQAETLADAERVLEIIAERPDLFQLGQHGYSATELPSLSLADATAEVRDAEVTLAGHGAGDLRPYFSPPGGAQNAAVLDLLGSLGYSTTVLWDVDPLDWKPPADGGPSAEQVAARVLDRVQGGSIVLLHLGGWNTLPALPAIIDGLEQRGLKAGDHRRPAGAVLTRRSDDSCVGPRDQRVAAGIDCRYSRGARAADRASSTNRVAE